MKSEIYSIGVDIGTSTTEVVVSRLKIKNILSSSLIKEPVIEGKEKWNRPKTLSIIDVPSKK